MAAQQLSCPQCQISLTIDGLKGQQNLRCPVCNRALTAGNAPAGGAEWYYLFNRQKMGPVSGALLQQLAADNRLRPTDMVLKQGMAKWVDAGTVTGLFKVVAPTKPAQEVAGATGAILQGNLAKIPLGTRPRSDLKLAGTAPGEKNQGSAVPSGPPKDQATSSPRDTAALDGQANTEEGTAAVPDQPAHQTWMGPVLRVLATGLRILVVGSGLVLVGLVRLILHLRNVLPRWLWRSAVGFFAMALAIGVYSLVPAGKDASIEIDVKDGRTEIDVKDASIEIDVDDQGADVQVLVDGQPIDRKQPLRLRSGGHRLVVTGKGIEPIERDFNVQPGVNPKLRARVQPIAWNAGEVGGAVGAGENVVVKGGAVQGNEVWSGRVYLDRDVFVPVGATLTIDPGTVVCVQARMDKQDQGRYPNLVELRVAGNLVARGTPFKPILFLAVEKQDDAKRGINVRRPPIIGPAARGETPNWGGIQFEKDGQGTLRSCQITNANIAVYADGSAPILQSCAMFECEYGIMCDNGATASIDGCFIFRCQEGIYFPAPCGPKITNCVITGCSNGIDYPQSTQKAFPTIDHNLILKVGVGVVHQGEFASITNNVIGGTFEGLLIWVDARRPLESLRGKLTCDQNAFWPETPGSRGVIQTWTGTGDQTIYTIVQPAWFQNNLTTGVTFRRPNYDFPPDGNWRLAENSPLLNRGRQGSPIGLDLDK